MNTLDNFNSIDIFSDITDTIIFHIPHSSTFIPNYYGYDTSVLPNEINLLTDFATDKIFNHHKITSIITPFSRVFCDVERFDNDEDEIMSKVGRGFFYTHTDRGSFLRADDKSVKEFVHENYYLPHHQKFTNMVNDKLNKYDTCLIIDCHSYSDIPFNTDLIKEQRPDFCIGTDNYHTPDYIIKALHTYLCAHNYTVNIDNPYSGTIVPKSMYKNDARVKSIMIEINRKLYMDNGIVDNDKVNLLNKMINNFIDTLHLYV